MERAELLRDLEWALAEMDKIADQHDGEPAPALGPAKLGGVATMQLISHGKTVPISRRYIAAIIQELQRTAPDGTEP